MLAVVHVYCLLSIPECAACTPIESNQPGELCQWKLELLVYLHTEYGYVKMFIDTTETYNMPFL